MKKTVKSEKAVEEMAMKKEKYYSKRQKRISNEKNGNRWMSNRGNGNTERCKIRVNGKKELAMRKR